MLFSPLSFFPDDRPISKIYAVRTTKLDIELPQHESWKFIYFGVESSKINIIRHKTMTAWGFAPREYWLLIV